MSHCGVQDTTTTRQNRMVKLLGLLSAAWYAVSYVSALSSTGNSVLVLLEPKLKREDYSTFFKGLESEYIEQF